MGKYSSSSSSRRMLIIISSLLVILSSSTDVVEATTGNHRHEWKWVNPTPAQAGSECRGSIGECMDPAESEMESESSRRILAETQYISYGALNGDFVPCSVRGASYYNCQTGAEANPYSRGCSAITQCRS